jgi:SAM-dependent methyltransferase
MTEPAAPPHAALQAASPWIVRWAGLIRPGGRVLDVACGSGRHLRWLAAHGFEVTGVDRDAVAIAPLQGLGRLVVADIEAGPWPLGTEAFDAVIVTNYLWRPLWPLLTDRLADGGVYLHETFRRGHETVGRPTNPDFLLGDGELLRATAGLRLVAFEDGFSESPPRFVQRVAAVRAPAGGVRRYPL